MALEPPTERQSALVELRGKIEDLVNEVNAVYDPSGHDEAMGGLAMILNNVHDDMSQILDAMIHKHGGKTPYGD